MSKKRYLVLVLLLLITFVIIPTISFASDPIENPDVFKPSSPNDSDITPITDKVKPVINAISISGVIISVITLTILGIKYMVGSVEERAEYKTSMMPYLIGCILLFSGSAIIGIIYNIVKNANLTT